jgi:SMC interacting uncharacterized protein involved in chromosome segregation
MDDTSLLLTEEFQNFSAKIKTIFEEKKAKKEQLKALYDKVQAEIKALDAKAKTAEEEFNKWKASQKGKPQD